MKSLTVRLPDHLVERLEAEAKRRKMSKSDIVRERLSATSAQPETSTLASIADLIGSVEGLPPDLSGKKKEYLRTTGYGRKRHR
jgi:Arc/MetJ-type ribon-helix-helix transcriptional regulator